LGFIFTGSNSIHHKAMQKGEFEQVEVNWLKNEFSNSDIFIDIGANAGYFSCLARSEGKKVIAIEPLYANCQILLRNIELNSGPPVEVFPVGLSSGVGIMKLYGFSSTGASLISNWAGAPTLFSKGIPVTTLDNLISERFHEERLLIKIDVEGFEYQVIKGAQSLLSRKIKPIWLVEITNAQFHPNGLNPHFINIYKEFWSRNYDCFVLTALGKEKIDMNDFANIDCFQSQGYINYIFVEKQNNN